MIISVHIPKTGGVTFREILRDLYRSEIFFDYTPWKKEDDLPEIPPKTKIIHGHIRTSKYLGQYPDAQLLTWLRNPVDIPVSMYYYFQRHPDMNNPLCRRLIEEHLSLEDFLLMRKNWNTISDYLSGVDISRFAFVGILEQYRASMELFKKVANQPSLQIDDTKKNVNPNKTKNGYDLSPQIIAYLQNACSRDCLIYEKGKRRFQELCQQHGIETVPFS